MKKCTKCDKPLKNKDFYRESRSKTNGKSKGIRAVCKSCYSKRAKLHYLQNREHLLKSQKLYRATNRVIISQRNKELKDKAYIAYGGYECACCGEREPLFLTIDHINNDGAKHRKKIKGGVHFYTWLKKNRFPKGFQILCYNCNCGRARNEGICPHDNIAEARKENKVV